MVVAALKVTSFTVIIASNLKARFSKRKVLIVSFVRLVKLSNFLCA